MHKLPSILIGVLVFAMVLAPSTGFAATRDDIEDLQDQIYSLMRQVEALRAQLSYQGGGVVTGGVDIARIQRLLASDPSIYPEGIASGYFGPLTRNAVMRFQQRFYLPVTGTLDTETLRYLNTIMAESGGFFPYGYLTRFSLADVRDGRFDDDCARDLARYGYCVVDDHYDDDIREIWLEFDYRDDETRVRVEYRNGDVERFTFDTTDEDDIIEELADELNMDEDDIEDLIDFDRRDDDIEEIRATVDERDDETRIRVEYEDGDIERFTYYTTDEDDVIEELADDLDMDEDDVEDLIEWDYEY